MVMRPRVDRVGFEPQVATEKVTEATGTMANT